jgi:signal transduction histidine kinase
MAPERSTTHDSTALPVEVLVRDAVADERLRIAHNLHDDILQVFAHINMQVVAIHRSLDREPEHVKPRIEELQQALLDAMRGVRFDIQSLRDAAAAPELATDLRQALPAIAARIERVWSLPVAAELSGDCAGFSHEFTRDIMRLASEALINVARHAHATRAALYVSCDSTHVTLNVSDDGTGFPFHGDFSHEDLRRDRLGPAVLRDRTTRLGGTLSLRSQPHDTRVTIVVPTPPRSTP